MKIFLKIFSYTFLFKMNFLISNEMSINLTIQDTKIKALFGEIQNPALSTELQSFYENIQDCLNNNLEDKNLKNYSQKAIECLGENYSILTYFYKDLRYFLYE